MMPRRVAAPRCVAGRVADAFASRAIAPQLCGYLDKYSKALIVHADNVGSNQLMMIRKARARAAWPRAAAGAGGAWARRWAARRREGETLNPGA